MADKVWTSEEITDLLNRNPKAVDRGIAQLADHLQEILYPDSTLIVQFNRYIKGLDDRNHPRWVGKSLSNPHSKIFIAQGHIDRPAVEVGRDLCIKYVEVLRKIANGETFLPVRFSLRTIRSGRYRDTETMSIYRNDMLPEEQKQFPLDIKHSGQPTPDDFNIIKLRFQKAGEECPFTEDQFRSQYTLVYRREYYLD